MSAKIFILVLLLIISQLVKGQSTGMVTLKITLNPIQTIAIKKTEHSVSTAESFKIVGTGLFGYQIGTRLAENTTHTNKTPEILKNNNCLKKYDSLDKNNIDKSEPISVNFKLIEESVKKYGCNLPSLHNILVYTILPK